MKSQGLKAKSSPKVFVGMSGGVDSSVSALLLKKAGYDVTGVFIKVWSPDFMNCTWKDDRLDAMRVASQLDIPFITIDLEKEYKEEVVDYMIREYKAGRTPNPDVFCNKHIKFGAFYKWAIGHGADYVATGHYARTRKLLASSFQLLASKDKEKDQSYFLWQIKKEQLSKILFPVGGMKKSEVRKLAKKFDLITADKKDSQGLCFVGKVDMKEFLSHFIPEKKGSVLDESGNKIGTHDGAFFFTIGQRHGFTTNTGKIKNKMPYYVVSKDLDKNTITVGHKSLEGNLESARKEILITNTNLFGDNLYDISYKLSARVRYRQPLEECAIQKIGDDLYRLTFKKPQVVANGQSVVMYEEDTVIGGGIVTS